MFLGRHAPPLLVHTCINNQWTPHTCKKAGPDVMQSQPLCRMYANMHMYTSLELTDIHNSPLPILAAGLNMTPFWIYHCASSGTLPREEKTKTKIGFPHAVIKMPYSYTTPMFRRSYENQIWKSMWQLSIQLLVLHMGKCGITLELEL